MEPKGPMRFVSVIGHPLLIREYDDLCLGSVGFVACQLTFWLEFYLSGFQQAGKIAGIIRQPQRRP